MGHVPGDPEKAWHQDKSRISRPHQPRGRSTRSTLLVSVRPRFAEAILSGSKRVELRRRMPRVDPSDLVLVYATVPSAAVVGAFEVETVLRLPLDRLWRRVKNMATVTEKEYAGYYRGLAEGVGIFVASMTRFENPVPLAELRRVWKGFHPPQGFRYISSCDIDRLNLLLLNAAYSRPARWVA